MEEFGIFSPVSSFNISSISRNLSDTNVTMEFVKVSDRNVLPSLPVNSFACPQDSY